VKLLIVILITAIAAFAPGCVEEYRVSLEADPREGGQLSGEGSYRTGTEVTVEAESAEGYLFREWKENGETVHTEKSYRFTVEEDRSLRAVFEEELLEGAAVRYADEHAAGAETIKVLDEEERIIFEYSIAEFRTWAQKHWEEIFEEIPAFADIETVYPEDFAAFDYTAALSPGGGKLAFSIHRYFAATFMSFVGVVNLQTEETALVSTENRGQIGEFLWSPRGTYIAYALNTAKGEAFFLSIDNVEEMEKEFTLSRDDIAAALEEGDPVGMPFFENMGWFEEEKRLQFTTNVRIDGEIEAIEWSIDAGGTDLRKESSQ